MQRIGISTLLLLAWAAAPLPGQAPAADKKQKQTVLVFEVVPRPDLGEGPPDPKLLAKLLPDHLKRRINPAGLYDVVIRGANSGKRVEIVLGGRRGKEVTAEEVRRIKELVSQVGVLEFKILANEVDDRQAIADARSWINDEANREALGQAAARGEPPPGLRAAEGKGPKRYTIELPGKHKSTVTYGWVELGPQQRRALNLDNAAKDDEKRNQAWKRLAAERGKALQLPRHDLPGRQLLQGALFYSRECKDRNLPEKERREKQVEYLVLARDSEIDPKSGKPTPPITGAFLLAAHADKEDGRPVVSFTFNNAGTNLFRELTRKNVPSGKGPEEAQVRRHLAIILDGLVMTAPTINSEIGSHVQISGDFTREEVDRLVQILRSGALPVRLRPVPATEETVEPPKK